MQKLLLSRFKMTNKPETYVHCSVSYALGKDPGKFRNAEKDTTIAPSGVLVVPVIIEDIPEEEEFVTVEARDKEGKLIYTHEYSKMDFVSDQDEEIDDDDVWVEDDDDEEKEKEEDD